MGKHSTISSENSFLACFFNFPKETSEDTMQEVMVNCFSQQSRLITHWDVWCRRAIGCVGGKSLETHQPSEIRAVTFISLGWKVCDSLWPDSPRCSAPTYLGRDAQPFSPSGWQLLFDLLACYGRQITFHELMIWYFCTGQKMYESLM